jgi:hypothetical protein
MKILYTLLLVSMTISAQDSDKPVIEVPAALKQYIPEGFTVMDTVYGNLNKDKYKDMIMVLKNVHEDVVVDDGRPLLLFLGQADGNYILAAKNDKVVLCYHCGGVLGDPYQQIVIKDGYFSIEHYGGSGWRWTRIITFKYSDRDKNWLLHKDGGVYYHGAEPEKMKTTVLTNKDFGRIKFEDFDYETDW